MPTSAVERNAKYKNMLIDRKKIIGKVWVMYKQKSIDKKPIKVSPPIYQNYTPIYLTDI